MGHARKERVLLFGTDQRITSGPAAKRPHSKAEYMTAPERFADSQIPLAPRAPSIHDPYVWSGRASQEISSIWWMYGLASMYPASGWSVELRATMDISARAFSLADRPRLGQTGHQGSHAPGRPVLHLVSFSRRPRQVRVWCHVMALLQLLCSCLMAVSLPRSRRLG